MTFVDAIHYGMWIAGFAFQALITLVMLRKRVVHEYPAFFVYTAFHVALFFVEFPSHYYSYPVYFYVYWVSNGISSILALLVLQELFKKLVRPCEPLQKRALLIFRASVVIVCLIALYLVRLQHLQLNDDRLLEALVAMQQAVGMVVFGLVVFLGLFRHVLGLGWRNTEVGIALGFSIYAAATMTSAITYEHLGHYGRWVVTFVMQTSYLLAIVVWTYYFVVFKSSIDKDELPRAEQLQAWNRALEVIESPNKPH